MEAVETVPQKNNLPTNYFRIPMVWLLGVHHRNLMTQPVVMACRGKASLHQTKSHLRSGGWFGSFSILKVALDRKLNWIMQVFVTNTLFLYCQMDFFYRNPPAHVLILGPCTSKHFRLMKLSKLHLRRGCEPVQLLLNITLNPSNPRPYPLCALFGRRWQNSKPGFPDSGMWLANVVSYWKGPLAICRDDITQPLNKLCWWQ